MQRVLAFIENAAAANCDAQTATVLSEAVADLFACTIAGTQAPVSDIVKKFAGIQYGTGDCTVFLSSGRMTPAGAALVNATMANALDADDGHRLTKGHPGAAVFPAALAAAESVGASGKQFLDAMLAGYEVAIRAGIVAHKLRPDYHCTGSWGALGAAAGVGKLLNASRQVLGHGLGIAEYQSTYSPMMRCIDAPSMLKDGIGWGSMAGLSAAYLAAGGFTGIPSLFAFAEAEDTIADFGERYRINELYYKPYACCRWAQPSIEAMKTLEQSGRIMKDSIDTITIHTFAESSRLIKTYPANTEEAQYNLYFPLASYLVCGDVGPRQVLGELRNPEILALMDRMEVRIDPDIDAQFPAKALSRLEIKLQNGDVLHSETMQARGDYDFPLSGEDKRAKFFRLTVPVLGDERSSILYDRLWHLSGLDHIRQVTELLRPSRQAD